MPQNPSYIWERGLGNEKQKCSAILRLVYQLFIGEIPKTYIIKHKDSDKMNYTIENLECVSPFKKNNTEIKFYK